MAFLSSEMCIRVSVVHASASWEPLFDCDGVFRGLCIILFDITNQRLDREKLAAKTSELDALLSIPVSYTHLDVYKRQALSGLRRLLKVETPLLSELL